MKNVIVTTTSNWVSEEVRDSLDMNEFNVIKDYGFDIPLNSEDIYAWWLPAAHAARVLKVMPDMHFTAPGSTWLSTLPRELTGREIVSLTLQELIDEPFTGKRWIKPAEAKIEALPALFYSYEELKNIVQDSHLEPSMNIQYTDTHIPFNWEHRFYVLDGRVITGSPYLVNDVVYNDGVPWDMHISAKIHAQDVVNILGSNQPKAYVLDIGLNEATGEWLVIEGNPAWCCGFYGSDMDSVIRCIHESLKFDDDWQWIPDPQLEKIASKKVFLKKP